MRIAFLTIMPFWALAVTGPADTLQVNQLLAQAKKNMLTQPDSGRSKAEQALNLSKKLDYEPGIGISYEVIGISYRAQTYNQISLSYLLNAAKYLERNNLKDELADTYTFIARNYSDMNNFPLAIDYIKRALALSIRIKDNIRLENIRNELALILYAQKDYNKSKSVVQQNLRTSILAKKRQDAILGRLYNRLAMIAEGQKDFARAQRYLDTSNVLAISSGDGKLKSDNLYSYSRYFLRAGDTGRALQTADASLYLADSLGDKRSTVKILKLLTNIQIKTGNQSAALVYQDRYVTIQESLAQADRLKSAALIEKLGAKPQSNDYVEGELLFQKKLSVWLGAFLSILIAGLLVVAVFYKQKKELSEELVSENDSIKEQKDSIEIQSQHLHELNDLKDKLFAIISHDLRSPIGNLRAMMELFQKGEMPNEEIASILREMLPSVEGADLIISNLLNWAISQMEGLKINRSNFLLQSVIKETETSFRYLLKDKHISLENNSDTGHVVFADKEHVRIIVRNLISNAVKFTPDYGKIKLFSKVNDQQVILAIEDSGQGMSNEEINNLFVNNTHFTKQGTKGEKGAGIGLMLCQEMAGLNNGKISVSSKQGESCTFFLALPKGLE